MRNRDKLSTRISDSEIGPGAAKAVSRILLEEAEIMNARLTLRVDELDQVQYAKAAAYVSACTELSDTFRRVASQKEKELLERKSNG